MTFSFYLRGSRQVLKRNELYAVVVVVYLLVQTKSKEDSAGLRTESVLASCSLTSQALTMLWSKIAKQMRKESTVASRTSRELNVLRMSRLDKRRKKRRSRNFQWRQCLLKYSKTLIYCSYKKKNLWRESFSRIETNASTKLHRYSEQILLLIDHSWKYGSSIHT